MKIYLTDICSDICPENVDLGQDERERTARIKAAVFDNIGLASPAAPRRATRKVFRTVLIAAIIMTLLGVTAYGITSFTMNINMGDGASGYWRELDENGDVISEQKISFPYASLIFTFNGVNEAGYTPEFRCFWLPCEAKASFTDEDGWTRYLQGQGESDSDFPYLITAANVRVDGSQYVISGDAQVVKEESWGNWHVAEISSDYSNCTDYFHYPDNHVNFILLFDETRGYLVQISGTSDMETLEHIARELEVRPSTVEYIPNPNVSAGISMLEPGNG